LRLRAGRELDEPVCRLIRGSALDPDGYHREVGAQRLGQGHDHVDALPGDNLPEDEVLVIAALTKDDLWVLTRRPPGGCPKSAVPSSHRLVEGQ